MEKKVTYELHIAGVKRTITNISLCVSPVFLGFYYNHEIKIGRVKKSGESIVAYCYTPAGLLLSKKIYSTEAHFDDAIKHCVREIIESYGKVAK